MMAETVFVGNSLLERIVCCDLNSFVSNPSPPSDSASNPDEAVQSALVETTATTRSFR